MAKKNVKLTKIPTNDPTRPPSLNGWWGNARYYDNDPSGAPEMAVSVDAELATEGQFFWGDPPVEIYNRSYLVVPDPNNMVRFKVVGDNTENEITHGAGAGVVKISEIQLEVDAPDGAKAAWENVEAKFHVSTGGFWQSWNQSGPSRDRRNGQVQSQPSLFVIRPPLLQTGYYSKVMFEGTIEFAVDPEVYPAEHELYAWVLAVRAP